MARKTDRRHRQGDESRRAILDATLAIAAERGYDGTTVALVTETTGLPASSIYWHFGNKDELLAATLEHSYQQWVAKAPSWGRSGSLPTASEIDEPFQKAAHALIQSPQFWSMGLLLTLQQRVKEPAARRLYRRIRRDREMVIEQWWSSALGAETTRVDPEAPQRLARFFMMMMDGLFVQQRSGVNRDTRRVVALMSAGLSAHLATGEAHASARGKEGAAP